MKQTLRSIILTTVWKLTPIIAFAIPILILYHLYPQSFEMTWKGRTYHLFFIWLLTLETILSWEALEASGWKIKSVKTPALLMVLALPTLYVVASNYAGLNGYIVSFALKHKVYFADMMPLTMEYFVFTILLTLIVLLRHNVKALSEYSISILFAGIIGLVYLVDNLYPFGRFTLFQMIVPTTTQLAASILNAMNFITEISSEIHPVYGSITRLTAKDAQGRYLTGFGVAWPCAGVDSLLLYSVTMLLFFKKSAFSLKASIAYFVVGAVITYFINVLRVVSIFLIAINKGDWRRFHDYYGPLYSVTWITIYPLIVLGIQLLWRKIKKR